jgi:hypothetical protein
MDVAIRSRLTAEVAANGWKLSLILLVAVALYSLRKSLPA